MSNVIDEKKVREVAMLGRLDLSEAEVSAFAVELNEILGYVGMLNELDTDGVEPLSHCLAVQNVFRDDQPAQTLTTSQALANAPEHDGQFFLVPRILDDNSDA